MTFDDMTLNVVVVRFVDGEVENRDGVATVSCHCRVTINTGFRQVLPLEEVFVVRSFADAIVDSDYNRIVDDEFQTVEHLRSVQIRSIIAVDALCVEWSNDGRIPLVNPLIRQIIRADIDGSIHTRVNDYSEYRSAVATVRGIALDGINSVGIKCLAVSSNGLTLNNMFFAIAVVRFVDCEVECYDRVTTVGCFHRIGINTALGQSHSLEGVEVILAFADAIVDLSPFNRQDVNEARVGAVITVVCLQVLDVQTGVVDRFLEQCAVSVRVHVIPCVRRLAGADGDRVAEQVGRMNNESYAVDTVARVLRMEQVSVATVRIERVTCYLASSLHMDPYVRCVNIGDVNRSVIVMTREDIKGQGDDTVATVLGRQRIVVDALVVQPAWLIIVGQTEANGVALADGHCDRVMLNRHHLNITHVRTIGLIVVCAEVLDILTGGVDIRLGSPGVWRLACADLNRITIEISLMDDQVQTIDGVATVAIGEGICIVTFRVD